MELSPTQLASEIHCSPLQALNILQQLKSQTVKHEQAEAGAAADGEQKQGEEKQNGQSDSTAVGGAAAKSSISATAAVPVPSVLSSLMGSAVKDSNISGESGFELMRRRQGLKPIPTLCHELDRLLQGGAPVGQITELCGVPGCQWKRERATMRARSH
jgi:hypothetical protein